MPRRPHALVCTALLSALLLLPSCTTQMLWGRDPLGDEHASYGHAPLWQRVVLTPFALLWDCVTLPAQLVLFDLADDDEEEDEAGNLVDG